MQFLSFTSWVEMDGGIMSYRSVSNLVLIGAFFLFSYGSFSNSLPQPAMNASLMEWAEFGTSKISHEDTRAKMWLLGGLRHHRLGNSKKGEVFLDRAVATLKGKISGIGTTWPILEQIVQGYIEIGLLEKARSLTEKILEPSHQASARLSLLELELKRIQERDLSYVQKLRTASTMGERQAIMQEMLNFDATRELIYFIEGIRDQKTRILAYEKGITHLMTGGSREAARSLLDSLLELNSKIRYKAQKGLLHVVFSRVKSLIEGKPELEFKKSGLELIRSVKDPVIRSRFGLEALRGSTLGREKVLQELGKLEKDALTIAYKDIRAQVLGEISSHYAVVDDEVGAFRVVALIWETLGTAKERILHDLIALQTIDVLLELDRFKEAHQWADAVRNPNRRAKGWMEIIPRHAESGDFDFVLKKTDSMDHHAYSLGAITASAYMSDQKISEEIKKSIIERIQRRVDQETP